MNPDRCQRNRQNPDRQGAAEHAAQCTRNSGVQRKDGGKVPHLPPRQRLVHRQTSTLSAFSSTPWGVTLTMARVRETYWIPRLRKLVKKVRGNCWGCKRFRVQAYQLPPPGNLLTTRTEGETPYQAVGVDLAGPIKYRI